ncbi:type II toxin-antitoxin system HipA family toxin [Tahibacter harae]|uniref:Type II toxin-antitoxin system HipA family toxin n=1 Tax=Tahibacter harae TaxID=2963937 RepID=A0ABT1QRI2_9GAMM|nr:type II toxin-antitoxin system HipA family toxin [Tahibacter harae]MCQ4164889.1 type II toxin-antitoxin system HipA family toxin [Tahibacter harae]
MKKLQVRYCGWGEDWPLGTLAETRDTLLFEYSPEALAQGLELSPYSLSLRSQSFADFPRFQQRLPGLIADALPDGWGMLLMDRLFRQHGIAATALSRLAFIGTRAMGALSFVPAQEWEAPAEELDLLALARESQAVLAGEGSADLLALALAGGSPQGARPKALLQVDPASGAVAQTGFAGSQPWLVKFQARGEHKEVCAVEHCYAALARACGIEMPQTAYFDLAPRQAAFGIARFDREAGLRVPMHSVAGLLQLDFRLPALDYTSFLRATRLLTRDEREVAKAYARAVFNVIFHNRDDHAKNFAYRLGRDRRWRLAPGYDLTYSEGPGGQHQTDICGVATQVSREHLFELARQGGVERQFAEETLELQLEQAGRFRAQAADHAIRAATVRQIARAIEANRLGLA